MSGCVADGLYILDTMGIPYHIWRVRLVVVVVVVGVLKNG